MHDIRDVSREMDRNGMESDMLHVVVEKTYGFIWLRLRYAPKLLKTSDVQNLGHCEVWGRSTHHP